MVNFLLLIKFYFFSEKTCLGRKKMMGDFSGDLIGEGEECWGLCSMLKMFLVGISDSWKLRTIQKPCFIRYASFSLFAINFMKKHPL